MRLFITNLLKQLGILIGRLIGWVAGNYRSRRFWLGVGLVILLVAGGIIIYRVLYPPVLVSPDVYPFESVESYQNFVDNRPLITAKVPSDQKFTKSSRIREDKSVVYTIELSQRPIKPQMDMAYVESYLAYLQNSQDEAKEWIRSMGQNPDELAIIWRPNPEEMRSKMLGESTKVVPQKDAAAPTVSPTLQPTATPAPRFPQ